jgi:NO-binding membrane sensor protein with MHYT domain
VAEIHHFAYGWINPALAYVMSFFGALLGLILAARARESTGRARTRWLVLAAIALGGTGFWLSHFMGLIGFDVPASVVRYNVWITIGSLILAVLIVGLGLFTVGHGRPSFIKIAVGGVFTGVGVATMHYAGLAGMRISGTITYDSALVGMSFAIAVVASTVALWFAVVIRGASATVGAAMLMAVAACSMHYTGMAAVRAELQSGLGPVPGVSPFELMAPITILACVVISSLAYATVGFSVRQEHAREEAMLARARDIHEVAAMMRVHSASGVPVRPR